MKKKSLILPHHLTGMMTIISCEKTVAMEILLIF